MKHILRILAPIFAVTLSSYAYFWDPKNDKCIYPDLHIVEKVIHIIILGVTAITAVWVVNLCYRFQIALKSDKPKENLKKLHRVAPKVVLAVGFVLSFYAYTSFFANDIPSNSTIVIGSRLMASLSMGIVAGLTVFIGFSIWIWGERVSEIENQVSEIGNQIQGVSGEAINKFRQVATGTLVGIVPATMISAINHLLKKPDAIESEEDNDAIASVFFKMHQWGDKIGHSDLSGRVWERIMATYFREEAIDVHTNAIATNLRNYVYFITEVLKVYLNKVENSDGIRLHYYACSQCTPNLMLNYGSHDELAHEDIFTGAFQRTTANLLNDQVEKCNFKRIFIYDEVPKRDQLSEYPWLRPLNGARSAISYDWAGEVPGLDAAEQKQNIDSDINKIIGQLDSLDVDTSPEPNRTQFQNIQVWVKKIKQKFFEGNLQELYRDCHLFQLLDLSCISAKQSLPSDLTVLSGQEHIGIGFGWYYLLTLKWALNRSSFEYGEEIKGKDFMERNLCSENGFQGIETSKIERKELGSLKDRAYDDFAIIGICEDGKDGEFIDGLILKSNFSAKSSIDDKKFIDRDNRTVLIEVIEKRQRTGGLPPFDDYVNTWKKLFGDT